MSKNDSLKRIIEMILEQVERLPNPPRESIKQELQKILEEFLPQKPTLCG